MYARVCYETGLPIQTTSKLLPNFLPLGLYHHCPVSLRHLQEAINEILSYLQLWNRCEATLDLGIEDVDRGESMFLRHGFRRVAHTALLLSSVDRFHLSGI